MPELIILTAMAIGMILVGLAPRVLWIGEDWRHLRLPDDWDKDKSRGRVNHRSDW